MGVKDWQTVSSKPVYQNIYFKVREDAVVRPDGEDGTYFVVEMNPAVTIVPVTKDNEVYLVGQNRYASKVYSLEVPAGRLEEENKLEEAKRELAEETGLISNEWEELGSLQVLNGCTNLVLHIFLAKNVTQTNKNEQEEEGINKMVKVPYRKAMDMIASGEITDSETISALTLGALKLKII